MDDSVAATIAALQAEIRRLQRRHERDVAAMKQLGRMNDLLIREVKVMKAKHVELEQRAATAEAKASAAAAITATAATTNTPPASWLQEHDLVTLDRAVEEAHAATTALSRASAALASSRAGMDALQAAVGAASGPASGAVATRKLLATTACYASGNPPPTSPPPPLPSTHLFSPSVSVSAPSSGHAASAAAPTRGDGATATADAIAWLTSTSPVPSPPGSLLLTTPPAGSFGTCTSSPLCGSKGSDGVDVDPPGWSQLFYNPATV